MLDGGSTDDTPDIVERFAREVPGVVHRRLERPGGIDADLATTISLASGEYCWLMSSDDAPAPGAIARMLREIESGEDVYLCNRLDCDKELRPIRQGAWLSRMRGARMFRLSERNDLDRYLAEARSIGALFSYMSAIVVRRAVWDASPPDPRAVGTNYAHVARLLSALLRGGTLRYFEAPLILCRGENDSSLEAASCGDSCSTSTGTSCSPTSCARRGHAEGVPARHAPRAPVVRLRRDPEPRRVARRVAPDPHQAAAVRLCPVAGEPRRGGGGDPADHVVREARLVRRSAPPQCDGSSKDGITRRRATP